MKHDLIDILACPEDKAPLTLDAAEEADGEVLTGTLISGIPSNATGPLADVSLGS